MGKVIYGGVTYDLGVAGTEPFAYGVEQAVATGDHRYLELRYYEDATQQESQNVVKTLVGPGIPIAFID